MIRKEHIHLWNDMPLHERQRLMPHMIETQINHILQCRERAERAHKQHLKVLDDHIKNLEKFLERECRTAKRMRIYE